jgi:osmotically-inducible protein OsmY
MRLLLLAGAAGFLYYVFRTPPRSALVDDDVLVTRVRLALDKLLEQPGSVNIAVQEGRVTLTGPAAQKEVRAVQRALRGMPGVHGVDCHLTAHA